MEQYEVGHSKVCGAMLNLLTGEGKALEASYSDPNNYLGISSLVKGG